MKKILIKSALVSVLFAGACGGDPTGPGPTANVRFFNATTGMAGSGGFTANGQFIPGSAVAFGQSTQGCATVTAGSTSFGFGAANTGGTGLNGSALTTLNSQTISTGGNFTVVATGSATNPTLFLLDNNFSGSLSSNQAAVRFVNLAPGTGTTANTFTVLTGTIGSSPTAVFATDIAVGSPTPFTSVTSGSNAFTILNGHEIVITGTAATLNLQTGTANTIAIVPNATGGFQLVDVPRCS